MPRFAKSVSERESVLMRLGSSLMRVATQSGGMSDAARSISVMHGRSHASAHTPCTSSGV